MKAFIQVNHSVCKTDSSLVLHPAIPISGRFGDEISVTKVIEESKCPDPKKFGETLKPNF